MSGLNLGFRIEERDGQHWVTRPAERGATGTRIDVRLATAEEVAMWPLVAIAEAADEVAALPDGHANIWLRVRRLRGALAAFRAAKEEQR